MESEVAGLNKYFIFLLMIFMHIVDDYYLQRILASMKQRDWWKENAPAKMYERDYMVALFMHAFSWAFMVMLPIAFSMGFAINVKFGVAFVSNLVIHAVVDHEKANVKSINLITDQWIHMFQIMITWICFF